MRRHLHLREKELPEEKSSYTGVTGYELAKMLSKESSYTKTEALKFVSSLEKKFKKKQIIYPEDNKE